MLRNNKSFLLFIIGLLFSVSFAANAQSVNALFHHANDPVAGNPKGKVTVVEFFDYQCGHCVSMAPVMSDIIRANPNVRVVFKELPIRGPMSELASRAALAANKQGKYYQFSHAILTSDQPLSEAVIFEIAKSTGLNVNRLKKDMNSSSIKNQLNANRSLANELQVSGTPAFFIGRTDAKDSNSVNFVLGEMSQSDLQNAIDKAGA